MATLTTKDLLQILPQPKIFSQDDDVEDFIKNIQEYFSMIQLDEHQRNIVIRAYLDEDARKKFDKTCNEDDFMKRLRSAFETNPDLAKDLENLLNYRKGNDSVEVYISKIERNVDKVMKHKLTTTKLNAFFLKHCLDNEVKKNEIQRYEITEDLLKAKINREDPTQETDGESRGPTPCKYIKQILQKMEKFKEKNDIGAVNKNSYANVVKQKINHHDQGYRNGNNYQKQENYFHQSRNFPQRKNDYSQRNRDYNQYDATRNQTGNNDRNGNNYRNQNEANNNYQYQRQPRQCYGCREFGHIRRECPNIRCSTCNQRGHFSSRCYERINDNDRNQRERGNYQSNVRDRIAALEDDCASEVDSKSEISGKVKALNSGEMLGAINHM